MKNLTRKGEEHNNYLPLILTIREIIFFAGKLLYGPFQAIFCPESSKNQFRVQKVSREIAHKIICPQKQKIISRIFIISGTLVIYVPLRPEPVFVNLLRSPGIDSQPWGPVRQPYT
jgi:hypothetical protein